MARPREFDVDQALGQAMRAFWERGYQGTSVGQLMKAAGVQKQSLYCAFGDKHSLFLKSLELYTEQVLTQVRSIIRETDSAFAAIEKVMHFAIRPAKMKNCPEGCLGANTALELGLTDPYAAKQVAKLFRGMEEMLEKAIKKGQESGEISTRFGSAVIAGSLVNTLNGIRILEKSGASLNKLNVTVDAALAMIKA